MVHQANHCTDVACCLKQMVKRDSMCEVQRHNALHTLCSTPLSIVSSLSPARLVPPPLSGLLLRLN